MRYLGVGAGAGAEAWVRVGARAGTGEEEWAGAGTGTGIEAGTGAGADWNLQVGRNTNKLTKSIKVKWNKFLLHIWQDPLAKMPAGLLMDMLHQIVLFSKPLDTYFTDVILVIW